MSVSIKDVAARAGVSLGTVSNVINRPELVRDKTLKRVQDAIAELGFIPNSSARTLRGGRARVLGLVVPDISNPFFTDLSKGVSDAALAAGYAVILCNTDESSEKEAQYLDVLSAQKVQGILITPARDNHAAVSGLLDKGIGVALVDREVGGNEACSVAVNDSVGGKLAFNHLYELGHREILLLTGATNIPQVHARESGIKNALNAIAKEQRPRLEVLRVNQMASASAHETLNEYITANGAWFSAIICGNDLLAFGAMRALHDQNLSVPDNISIVGYDDIDFAANAHVPLTTIAQPKYQLGHAAAELVIQDCEHPDDHVHQRIEFQPKLVVRQSTMQLPVRKI